MRERLDINFGLLHPFIFTPATNDILYENTFYLVRIPYNRITLSVNWVGLFDLNLSVCCPNKGLN